LSRATLCGPDAIRESCSRPLGFKPQVSLAEGLKKAINWFLENEDRLEDWFRSDTGKIWQ